MTDESGSTSLSSAVARLNVGQSNSESLQPLHGATAQRCYVQGGTNNRQINVETITHYYEASQSTAAPLPKHTLPFTRDEDFIERPELALLEQKLSRPGTRVALYGLGGIGKSQLAIEYCYRRRDSSPSTWVLWIHASNAARFDQDIRKLADDVKIPGRDNSIANNFRLVYSWLMDSSQPWLIVLDNADDMDYLFEPPVASSDSTTGGPLRPRIEYLPVCDNGAILITSRRRDVALKLAGHAHSLELHPDKELAMSLIRRGLTQVNDAEAIEKLAMILDCMPLAIAQAVAYIKKESPCCTLAKYLAMLERTNDNKIQLLSRESDTLRQDIREANPAIMLTWRISMERMQSSNGTAVCLLAIMSFYNCQGIPEFLLDVKGQHPIKQPMWNLDLTTQNFDQQDHPTHAPETGRKDSSRQNPRCSSLDDAISILRDYSFVSVSPDGASFKMHRLVQLATQAWLDQQGLLTMWLTQSLRRLDLAYPRVGYEVMEQCRALQPHAKLMLEVKVEEDAMVPLAAILGKAAWFACYQGEYTEAVKLMRRSTDIYSRTLGKDDPWTLHGMRGLGKMLMLQGKFKDAEPVLEDTLRRYEAVAGKDHDRTLDAVQELAWNRRSQGDLGNAEQLYRRVLDGRTSRHGADDNMTLICVNNLALVLSDQGKHKEAESMHRRALQAREKVLGKEHPDTRGSIHNLALTLSAQGEYDAAEPMFRRALELEEKALGEDHPDTLTNVRNLANLLRNQGNQEEAEAMYRRALEGSERMLGKEHPDTLATAGHFAEFRRRQQNNEAALQLYQRAAGGFLKTLGPSHPTTVCWWRHLLAFQKHLSTVKPAAGQSIPRASDASTPTS